MCNPHEERGKGPIGLCDTQVTAISTVTEDASSFKPGIGLFPCASLITRPTREGEREWTDGERRAFSYKIKKG